MYIHIYIYIHIDEANLPANMAGVDPYAGDPHQETPSVAANVATDVRTGFPSRVIR